MTSKVKQRQTLVTMVTAGTAVNGLKQYFGWPDQPLKYALLCQPCSSLTRRFLKIYLCYEMPFILFYLAVELLGPVVSS